MASWYDKNIIPQSGFGAETEGSPMLTFTVGVAIGALGMYAWQNRDELKKHVKAPGLHLPALTERSANWRSGPPPAGLAVTHERNVNGSLTGRWKYINELTDVTPTGSVIMAEKD